jgi:nitrogen fixation/metabolism regulation signal transduction histidine kinase
LSASTYYKNFRVNCALRVILLAAIILLFAWLLSRDQYITLVVCGAVIVYQVYSLIRYVEFTNRNLALFLQSIEYSDLSRRLHPGPVGRSFADLDAAFEKVLSRFREMRTVQEESHRYLDAVVQHIGVGMIAFGPSGEVKLLNPAARTLLDFAALKNVDDLESVYPELRAALRALEPGKRELVTITVRDEVKQLSLHATELFQRGEVLMLVSMQNIGVELDEKEMDAWRDMIRVLTHEIKNSLTPIASLSGSVEKLALERGEATATDALAPRDEKIRDALRIIQKRSEGLLEFVDAYRDLTHLPPPRIALFEVKDLFDRVERLVAPQLEETAAGVAIRTTIDPPGMSLTADQHMVEQALINLVLNALEATAGRPGAEVSLAASFDDRSRSVIQVADNGPGIVTESLEKIFVPFYSTKKGGSGIGLSLSRQIMRLHRGSLTVTSEAGVRTVFTMRF